MFERLGRSCSVATLTTASRRSGDDAIRTHVEATGYNDDELDYDLGSASQKYDLVP
jgi:hypothetical protein